MREQVIYTLKQIAYVAFFVLVLVPIFRPRFVQQAADGMYMDAFRIWLGVAAIVVTVLLLRRGKHAGLFSFVSFALFTVLLVSTILNHGSKMTWYDAWLPCWAAVALVGAFLRERPKELLVAIWLVTFTLSFLDLVSMVLHPGGIFTSSVYFFGNRNAAFQVFFPAMLSSFMLGNEGLKVFYPLCALSTLVGCGQLYLGGSVTSSIAMAFCLICFLLSFIRRIRGFLNLYAMIGVSVSGFLLVVIARIQDFLGGVVTGVLHKSITLSGRTGIWDKVFQMSDWSHALWGWGLSGHENLVVDGIHFYFAHNVFLEFWLDGGLVGLALFLFTILVAARKSFAWRDCSTMSAVAVVLGGCFVVGITESMVSPAFFLMLSIAYYWPCRRDAEEKIACMREADVASYRASQ